ncbi:MAG: hypothetical protein V1855_04010 [bacterium]
MEDLKLPHGAEAVINNLPAALTREPIEAGHAQILESATRQVVANFRFDVLGIYDDLLSRLTPQNTIFDAFEDWKSDIEADALHYGGSDCFGLAVLIVKKLAENGVAASIIPLDTEGLPTNEAKEVTGDVGSVGVLVRDQDSLAFVEPGFAQTKPLIITRNAPSAEVSIDGRQFGLTMDFSSGKGIFEAKANHQSSKQIGVSLEPLTLEDLPRLQKQHLLIRPTIHCDRFNADGEKIAGFKIRLLSNEIALFFGSQEKIVKFEAWIDFSEKEKLAEELHVDVAQLDIQVNNILRHAGQLRALWQESLIRAHYETAGESQLEQTQRSWQEAREAGFASGGVVAVIVDKTHKKILLYRIPQSRENSQIGRFAGQLNTFVEKANMQDGAPTEEFKDNLERGIKEELGLQPENFTLRADSYRETRYGMPLLDGKKVLARCCVLECDLGDVDAFKFQDEREGGNWQWFDIDEVLGYEIEPNLRSILGKYILENLL